MATIKCKGLTGVQFDLTVTMGSTTMNGLTALAQAVEGQEIVTAMYAEIHATKDPSINQTNDGAKHLQRRVWLTVIPFIVSRDTQVPTVSKDKDKKKN